MALLNHYPIEVHKHVVAPALKTIKENDMVKYAAKRAKTQKLKEREVQKQKLTEAKARHEKTPFLRETLERKLDAVERQLEHTKGAGVR